MSEPNWFIQIVIGSLLALLAPYCWRICKLFFFHFQKNYLLRDWYCYHYSYKKNEPIYLKSVWKIRRAVRSDFKVKITVGDNLLHYVGHLKFEENHVLIKASSSEHKETLIFRIEYKIQSNSDILYGIGLSFDHDGKIISSAMILSKKKLTEKVSKSFLLNKFETKKEYNIIRIP